MKLMFMKRVVVAGLLVLGPLTAIAQERRARPPKYSPGDFRGVFDDVSTVIRGDRPRVDQLQGSGAGKGASGTPAAAPSGSESTSSDQKWASLTEPVNLEDEVKRLKLHYDELVTTPARFNGGGFQDARTDLALLATLFAVISEFEGDVRFKKDAAIARDLLARSAVQVTTGSSETFEVAKARKADLQDIVSGSGLNRTAPTEATDWSLVTTRSPVMEYLELLLDDPLESGTTDAASVSDSMDDLKRSAAMVAVMAEVLNQPGMEGADDDDYRAFSDRMKKAALDLRSALQREDADAARLAVGAISQSCSACHDVYR